MPRIKPNFALYVAFLTSAYGGPRTSLSFVCLRARDQKWSFFLGSSAFAMNCYEQWKLLV